MDPVDMSQATYKIEVCFSPLSWPLFKTPGSLVVIADIFRATTAMCAAFHNGVRAIIPVSEISQSEAYKQQGYIVAGERDGKKLDCADFGNSPFNFLDPALRGKTIVMNTTNGTQAIRVAAGDDHEVVIGSFLNVSALSAYIMEQGRDVTVFCAGWKNRFSLEDGLFAGALTEALLVGGGNRYLTRCDSALASTDLWLLARGNPRQYIEKAAHRHRLRNMGLDDIIDFAMTPDLTSAIPVLRGMEIVNARQI
jgi:2-phosphosulfolactate phosphatase